MAPKYAKKRTVYRRKTVTKASLRPMVKRIMFTADEKKYNDVSIYNSNAMGSNFNRYFMLASYADPLALSVLNNISQGTVADATHRIGNNIFVSGVHFGLSLTMNPASHGGEDYKFGRTCRILVVHNRSVGDGGAIPPITDIFNFTSQGIMALRNSASYPRFDILMDKYHVMTPTSLSPDGLDSIGGATATCNFYIPVNKKIQYRSSNTTDTLIAYPGGAPANTDADFNIKYTTCDNLTKDDINVYIVSDDAFCCMAQLSWKVVFTDS